ncbi:MAG TPA: hydroxymethylglutaryl-CoA lyase [Vicinamibacteria bacterium]|nr:hydroxymethylglutaryl-CoA lyase [Vicinamibacteria bacterium]
MRFPTQVTLVEVGPRDGLQNEAASLTIDERVAFCELLLDAGVSVLEVGAFVSPSWVPQMAGSDEVFRRLKPRSGARRVVLVPNRKGFETARAAGVTDIAVFTAASETFNRKNTNASIDESFERFRAFVPEARRGGMWVRGYVSTCFGCPYEGAVAPEKVVDVARKLLDLGCQEISIGDTIGVAVPSQVADVVGRLQGAMPNKCLAVHFHDTRGTALANVLAALEAGVAIVDSAAGGLGGCPYAPGASGNLATEDLLYMLHGMGIVTGVSLEGVVTASRSLEKRIGHSLPSRYLQAGRVSLSAPSRS